ncbi:MAG: TetR/AcrR family transcriptional regulator [Burkholderiaceae bacterium]|nr:TetR/AcrR family transcriptional regulator [Burkholderiaceae bacterium]
MSAVPKTVRKSPPRTRGVRWNDAVQSREERNEAKRVALIRAAGRAFKAKGFHNTSLDEVAALLNLTKPTLYYYVSSKADLLYQCHDYALDLGEAAFQHGQEGRTGLDKLRRTLAKYMESMTHDFAAYSVLSDLNDMTPAQKRAIQKRRREFDTRFRALVSEGMADGSIREVDPMLTVAWFMGAINAIPRWFSEDGPLNGAQVADAYTDLLTRGLRV